MPLRPAAVLVSLALACPTALLSGPAQAAAPAKPYEVNGDGSPDLAVGGSGPRAARRQR